MTEEDKQQGLNIAQVKLLQLVSKEIICLRFACLSLIATHPEPEKVKEMFLNQVNNYKDEWKKEGDIKAEENLQHCYQFIRLIDEAIENQQDCAAKI